MKETYHFYANSLLGDGFRPDIRTRDDRTYIRFAIKDLEALRTAFDKLLAEGKRIDRLLTETHVTPGAIYFGDQSITFSNVYFWLGSRGYENLFNPDGFIYLDGCNISEGELGRNFLQRFGAILLSLRGGTCSAWISKGKTSSLLWSGKTWHLFGDYIKAKFPSGERLSKIVTPAKYDGELIDGLDIEL